VALRLVDSLHPAQTRGGEAAYQSGLSLLDDEGGAAAQRTSHRRRVPQLGRGERLTTRCVVLVMLACIGAAGVVVLQYHVGV
jgi:hypothetical protein